MIPPLYFARSHQIPPDPTRSHQPLKRQRALLAPSPTSAVSHAVQITRSHQPLRRKTTPCFYSAPPINPGRFGRKPGPLSLGADSPFLIRLAARRNSNSGPPRPEAKLLIPKARARNPSSFFLRLLSRHFYRRVTIVPQLFALFFR
jgi:hypothetical protein